LPVNLTSLEENIFDVAGVRVICSFPEDIYMLEECFLKQDDVRLIERKDYIQNAKPSGYRSLHLIVETPIFLENEKRMMKVEVQLRTIAMDFWASLDHKLQYKKNISEDMQESLKAQLLECANISADLDKRMEAIRNQLEEAQSESKP
jgi:putative GTP pyrophosphokinase